MKHKRKLLPEVPPGGPGIGWLFKCVHCGDLYIGLDPDVEDVEGCRGARIEGKQPMGVNPNLSLTERFHQSYRIDSSGCWLWTGGSISWGYGYINHEGKRRRAHRVSFFLHHGFWAPQVNHTCDVKACVNPDHLYAGSQRDNMRDRAARFDGRTGKSCQFTPAQIEEMRTSGETQRALAKEHGVSQPYVSRLLRGKRGAQ